MIKCFGASKRSPGRGMEWVEARPDGGFGHSLSRAETCLTLERVSLMTGFGAGKIVGAIPIHWRASTHPAQYPGYACLSRDTAENQTVDIQFNTWSWNGVWPFGFVL